MSSNTGKAIDRRRALRASAESEALSDSDHEDRHDIAQSSRKSLDLSQYIDVLTQSQSQNTNTKLTGRDIVDLSPDDDFQPTRQAKSPNLPPSESGADAFAAEEDRNAESDWSEEDTTAVYRAWKDRRTNKRKRVAAETNRIRAQKKSEAAAAAASSIVGRKPVSKNREWSKPNPLSTSSGAEDADTIPTYLDDPIPDYVTLRQQNLQMLREAGLRYPPSYENIDLQVADKDEKPVLDKTIKPQREKMPIRLKESGAIVPAPIAQWLRNYQVEGVQFLHKAFVRQTGAILGDDMGLGKTIQIIAFLTAAFGKTATKSDAKCMRAVRGEDKDRWYPRIMVICPGTLMQNWEDELAKWGWWEVYRYHGNGAERKGVLSAAAAGMLEIMITTYTTYRNHESEINTVNWDCVVADECHQIKSKDAEITKAMNRINALCRIGLTGTAIQNKYEELWNLLNWARPGAYGSAQEWKQTVCLPLKLGQAHDATNAQLADARSRAQDLVHNILPSVFLRRMKTLISHQLPKKSDRIIFCQLTKTQADAYRHFLESPPCAFIQTAKGDCDCGSGKKRGWCCYVTVPDTDQNWANFVFPCIATLMKLANHLALIVPQSSDPPEKKAKDKKLLELACPFNHEKLDQDRDKILQQSQREFCGKWKVLRRLLDFWHSNGDKVLVFSHSVRLLRLLRGLFDIDGTKYNVSYLDGSMKYDDRSRAVADFNSDPEQFVFLMSTKAGGVGLNITSANKVVIVDPHWNPAYDLQAQDRAYRIGQTRDVEVFRLVSSGTIEELVYARQIYKQQQANIGYNASEERRYFKGVMDNADKKGELFGLENLFTFQHDSILLRDIMHKTNIAETKAGITAADFHYIPPPTSPNNESYPPTTTTTSSTSLNLLEIKHLVNSYTSNSSTSTFTSYEPPTPHPHLDPINAILAKAGVQYTHENSQVIGPSEVEARLGQQAQTLRNDTCHSSKPVFHSQPQTQIQTQNNLPIISPHHNHTNATNILSITPFSYRYRPNLQIRKRLFCSVARSMGFDHPVEFALLVESSTQAERRRMLDMFYAGRRRALGGGE